MKLLSDENLSDRLVDRLSSLYPDAQHVKTGGLVHTDDSLVWKFAKENGFCIVSKDADFHQRSLLYGAPPKFIYLRVGNCPTSKIIQLLRLNHGMIAAFTNDTATSILVLS